MKVNQSTYTPYRSHSSLERCQIFNVLLIVVHVSPAVIVKLLGEVKAHRGLGVDVSALQTLYSLEGLSDL